MSEQTRMSKYKDLRDNIDDDTYVPHEEDDADDDFRDFDSCRASDLKKR